MMSFAALTATATPVYSGYASISPLTSALSMISVLPMFDFSSTVYPLASSAWV